MDELTNGYEYHHQQIAKGIEGFYAVGASLVAMRDNKLYKEGGYKTFREYCVVEHGIKKSEAYRIIAAGSIEKKLGCDPKVAKHLTRVPEESRVEVYESAKQRVEDEHNITRELVLDINDEIVEKAVDDEVRDSIAATEGDIDLWDIKNLMQTIQRALNDLKVVKDLPCGAHLPVNRLETDLLNAKDAVKLAVPDTKCPICDGAGCKFCNGTGWVPASLAKVAKDRFA